MEHNICVFTCRRQMPYAPECWCPECRKDEADAMDCLHDEWHSEIEARRIATAVAASDAEWSAHLDTIAPLVGAQAVEILPYRLRLIPTGEPLPERPRGQYPFANGDCDQFVDL